MHFTLISVQKLAEIFCCKFYEIVNSFPGFISMENLLITCDELFGFWLSLTYMNCVLTLSFLFLIFFYHFTFSTILYCLIRPSSIEDVNIWGVEEVLVPERIWLFKLQTKSYKCLIMKKEEKSGLAKNQDFSWSSFMGDAWNAYKPQFLV